MNGINKTYPIITRGRHILGPLYTDIEYMYRLRVFLDHHRYLYTYSTPTLSDADYDLIMRCLEDYEEAYPEFITSDSPTQQVGAKLPDERWI